MKRRRVEVESAGSGTATETRRETDPRNRWLGRLCIRTNGSMVGHMINTAGESHQEASKAEVGINMIELALRNTYYHRHRHTQAHTHRHSHTCTHTGTHNHTHAQLSHRYTRRIHVQDKTTFDTHGQRQPGTFNQQQTQHRSGNQTQHISQGIIVIYASEHTNPAECARHSD